MHRSLYRSSTCALELIYPSKRGEDATVDPKGAAAKNTKLARSLDFNREDVSIAFRCSPFVVFMTIC